MYSLSFLRAMLSWQVLSQCPAAWRRVSLSYRYGCSLLPAVSVVPRVLKGMLGLDRPSPIQSPIFRGNSPEGKNVRADEVVFARVQVRPAIPQRAGYFAANSNGA